MNMMQDFQPEIREEYEDNPVDDDFMSENEEEIEL